LDGMGTEGASFAAGWTTSLEEKKEKKPTVILRSLHAPRLRSSDVDSLPVLAKGKRGKEKVRRSAVLESGEMAKMDPLSPRRLSRGGRKEEKKREKEERQCLASLESGEQFGPF